MVGGTAHHQHQQQQQQPSQLAPPLTTASTEEEEFLKRNTDCVYFLASPLTCKKGSECEYRHSEIARVNTRDCWYWLNGNCLNPKCAFRHPPLDGLLGAEIPTPVPPLQSPATPATTYAMPKQGVACIFFQKGFCLKGHLCPFLHGPPNSINNKPPPAGPANPVTDPPKTTISGPEKSNTQKPEFQPPHGKQPPRIPARNGGGAASVKVVPPPMAREEAARHRPTTVVPPPPAVNEIAAGKDIDEYSREPSPGFDVLVDNEIEDSEYYHNEEQFGRSRGHDYDTGHATDFDVERDMYREQRDYERYDNRERIQYRDDHRGASEMKAYPRNDSPDRFDESDLRHRISSQRRVNSVGLRSVVSRENVDDRRVDRRVDHRDHHNHNHHHRPPAQSSVSSRLRGRIQIPGRSKSPIGRNDSRAEREIDIRRQLRSRYSSERPVQSRLRDRVKGRTMDDFEGSNSRGSRGRREMGSDNDTEFSGPKRLSELKSGKTREDDRQSLGKRKYPIVDQSQSQQSFEGPMPLSEILKRKRGTVDTHVSNVNNKDNNPKEINENERKASFGSIIETIKEESNLKQIESINNEKNQSMDTGEGSLNQEEEEEEEGMIDEDAILDEELEGYDNKDGDYDYDQIDGEDYNLDEGEEEYIDEEDEDFEKKENVVVYS